ncbi:hypothetical protein [Tenacibaculum xiamenense]|uniref:hypothetical protein n=1 Tax=Tenacibaculum xiamenense TaxID=1261553 RepID=UPI003895285D
MKTTILTLAFLFATALCSAQEHPEHSETSHKKEKDPGFEIVLSGIGIYSPEHKHWNSAIETHLTYWTTHKWAFGVGYSIIFEDELEHEIAALVSHKPYKFLTLNFGPSFSLPNEHKDTKVSAYLESEFAFHVGEIHFGPTIGVLAGEDFRIFGGLHISYEF